MPLKVTDTMLQTALKLAEQGFYVFPVKQNSKQPAIKGWQQKATTDLDTIQRWWSGYHKERNIGIATGPSNLMVVDLDTKSDGIENWAKLTEEYGWTDTKTVETPSLGMHLYFSAPEGVDVRSTVSLLAEGVDTRATGGYVVAQGSSTSVGTYSGIIDIPIAPCPEWLIPKLKRTFTPPDKAYITGSASLDTAIDVQTATEFLAERNGAIQGEGGDSYTYKTCCILYDMAISQEMAVELMMEHWNDRCEPPWTSHELWVKMSNAYDFAQSPPGTKSLDPGAVVSAPKHVHRVSDMQLIMPKRDWLIEGRLIAGYVTLTVAPGGVGKSMFTMLEAIAVATGQPLTGIKPTRRGAVLIYNTEDPQDEIERRLYAICLAHKIDPKTLDNVYYASGVQSPLRFVTQETGRTTVTKDRKKLEEIIKDNEIVLTVIDPFVRSHGVDENSNSAIDLVVQQMSSLGMATESAISVVHHSKKVGQHSIAGDMDAARGASSLASASRIVSTVSSPTADEITEMGINPMERHSLLRIDQAKGNMVGPQTAPRWFRRIGIELPNGDNVGTIEAIHIKGGIPPEESLIDDKTAQKVLKIIAPYYGMGTMPTDDIIPDLPTLVPEIFRRMGINARKRHLQNLFKQWVSNDTYKIKVDQQTTYIGGILTWNSE